jgi:hypothetical protein
MKLAEANKLLLEDGVADNNRYFTDLYKLYNFKEEDELKDYIDFILHEPVHWLRGFPAKLTSKPAFAKPKTAIIKLLKKSEVISALGQTYTENAYDVIWKTFKKEHDTIINERNTKTGLAAVPASTMPSSAASSMTGPDVGDTESLGSYESLPPVPTVCLNTQPSRRQMNVSKIQVLNPRNSDGSTEERVEFLKSLLYKFADTMPSPAIADAFRLLVERV